MFYIASICFFIIIRQTSCNKEEGKCVKKDALGSTNLSFGATDQVTSTQFIMTPESKQLAKQFEGGNNAVNLNVCCDYYEKDNGTCIECAVGYTSKSGYPCKKCSMKTYGLKCLELCECTVEKCDHVRGCISESSSNESISVNITIESSVWLQTSRPRTVTDTYKHSQGLLVYVICAGCVTFVITITGIVMIHKRKRKRSYLTVRHQVNNSTNQQTQDLSDEQYTTIL